MIRTALMCLMMMLSTGTALAAGDTAAGKTKATTCTACHGPDGNSINPEWPSLAGQNERYLATQIMDFQAGETRKNVMMEPMIANLTDQDVADIAAYYASLPRRGLFADEEQLEMIRDGEKLYRGGNQDKGIAACMGCHGPAGNGNSLAGFPSVGNQHAKYTAMQLRAFRSGERMNDLNAMMRDVSERLTDYEIDAVSAYLSGLN